MCIDTVASPAAKKYLAGQGIDWGTGIGVLALVAAHWPQVTHLFALDICTENVKCAKRNAELNELANKVTCMRADSFEPLDEEDRQV